ncbi:hypothetical protein G7Y89_g2052 [Cudoniella acicularis]|uniref:Uncharacterized protein n=1 Tax=Cudoniella acicularis TaxID=354080 RepID=A0A8H4RUW1_9HELO|nr:hypothetical protein G7Y89_g2052 [Cudoniella acicularis]
MTGDLSLTSTAPRTRLRAASCDSIFRDQQTRHPRPSLSPLVSWDDSALVDKHHVALSAEEDQLQKGQNMGIAARRIANINVFDDSVSDVSLCSGPPSLAHSDWEDEFPEKRLLHPVEYFQELDDLGSKIYQRSAFQPLIDGSVYRPFDSTVRFKALFLENASFQSCTVAEILSFCMEVTHLANKNASGPQVGSHYVDHRMHHRQIEQLVHLIECRNVISGVWQNIKEMKQACYCGDFISSLVCDSTRIGVARLVQIECSRIERLAIAFEACLLQVLSHHPTMVLLDIITTVSNDVSTACREVLTKIDINIPDLDSKDVWRCVVHILDVAVLSYVGAHTQFLGSETTTSVAVPGPFLQRQYFRFCRRTFSCLSEFLGGQEAWVLEPYHAGTFHVGLPPLCLLTDAVTFGDIWGPMWKSCVLGHEDQITQYSVGNGVIIPWEQLCSGSKDAIEVRKGEIFCHWMSDREGRDEENLAKSSTPLRESDTILIGAPVRLDANDTCRASTIDHRQRLRNSGSLAELGTVKPGRVLESETVQVQVTPPHMGVGYQRQYKIRGRSMKKSLIEKWKNFPLSRQVRYLEFKLGLEVSTCTHNARRIRLIDLFGTQTMLNYLRNVSLEWTSPECRESFYSALQSNDHTAFRKLYESKPDWQTDLGNAIGCCFDILVNTGKSEKDLVLFWQPDAKPGEKVTLKSNELSWIGFLEDTETSGTLAVLEDRCLELPDLEIGGKCRSNHFDPRNIGSGIATRTFDRSILETSVHLNEYCVPTSIRKGRIISRRHDGTPSSHPYRWSLLSLEEGDKFEFGKKGSLKAITQLTQGQILAKWSSSLDIKRQVQTMSSKIPVLGRIIDQPPPNIHEECIRDRKEDTSPATSSSLGFRPRPYHYDPSDSGTPRNENSQSSLQQDTTNELRNIINRWKMQFRNPSEWSRQEWEQ